MLRCEINVKLVSLNTAQKKNSQYILPLSYSFIHFNIEIKHASLLTFRIKVTCVVEIAFFIALLIFCNLEIFVSQSTFLSPSSF